MTFTPSKETENFLEKQELYLTAFQNSDPRHFDMVPEILDYLTYLDTQTDPNTGEITYYRKSLTSNDINFYRIIKQKAGSQNKAWVDGKDYARQMKCHENSITKYKRILQMPFEQLEGYSLIDVETQYSLKEKNGKLIPEERHIISGIHIWNYNNAFMETCDRNAYPEKSVQISKEEYEVSYEKMRQKSIRAEIVHKTVDNSPPSHKFCDQGGYGVTKKMTTPQDRNHKFCDVNKLHTTNPFVNVTNPTDSAAQAASSATCDFHQSKENLFVKDPQVAFLVERGVSLGVAMDLLFKEGREALDQAIDYVIARMKKKPIANPAGYLVQTVKKKWYLQEKLS